MSPKQFLMQSPNLQYLHKGCRTQLCKTLFLVYQKRICDPKSNPVANKIKSDTGYTAVQHAHEVLVWRSYPCASPQTRSTKNIGLKSLQHKCRFVLSHKMTLTWLTALRTKKSGLSPSQKFPFLCTVLCCCRCQGAKEKKGAADLLLCRAERSGLSLITKDQLCQPTAPLIIIVASSNSGTNL